MWRFVSLYLLCVAAIVFEYLPFDSVAVLFIWWILVCCLSLLFLLIVFLLQDCFPEFWVTPFLLLFPIPFPRLLGFFRPLVFLSVSCMTPLHQLSLLARFSCCLLVLDLLGSVDREFWRSAFLRVLPNRWRRCQDTR